MPDFADGFNWDGKVGTVDDVTTNKHFVPVILEISQPIEYRSQGTVR